MSAFALVSGLLFRAAERKVSNGGKPYVSATIRTRDGAQSQFWRLVIFSESASEEIMRLKDGDALAAQGVLKVEPYEKDGETRIGYSQLCDAILPARGRAKPRKEDKPVEPAAPSPRRRSTAEMAANGGERYAPAPRHWSGDGRAEAGLDDDIPF